MPGPIPTGAPVHAVKAGAGTFIQPGLQAGYGIAANTGGSYRIVWTGDATGSSRVERRNVDSVVAEMSHALQGSMDQLLTGMEQQFSRTEISSAK